jgi:hypothetical protein
VGVVGVTNQRPDDVTALVRDQLLQIRIAVIGRALGELVLDPEGRLRVVDHGRKIIMSGIFDQERPVVGDAFGKQRKDEQRQENPQ